MKQLAPDIQTQIVALYIAGRGAQSIATELGVSKAAVLAALWRNGAPVRPAKCPKPVRVSDDVRGDILATYAGGVNASAVARLFGVSQKTVFNVLEGNGVTARGLEETTRNPNHRHDFFSAIDTDAKAWALGLLAADGNVSRRSNSIHLSLKAGDADAVEKLRALVCPTAPVVRRASRDSHTRLMTEYAHLTWNSKQTKEDLARCGVTPAKSKTLVPWAGPEHLLPAYWRGILDGDGSWSIYGRKGYVIRRHSLSLTGTRAVAEGFRDFVFARVGVIPSVCPSRTAWVCMVSNMTAIKAIVPIIYSNATVWLDRKRRLAEQILTRPVRRYAGSP